MTIKHWIDRHHTKLLILIAAAILFLSIGGHAFQFWEKPALSMAAGFVLSVPVLAWGLFHALKRLQPQFNLLSRKRLIALIVPAILLSIAITWFYYRVPPSYHVITIRPLVSQSQWVELVELKSNGSIIPVDEKKAAEYGWQVNGETLVATSGSQPLKVSFKAPAGAPLILLFYTSPEGGDVSISFEDQQAELDLNSPEKRQTTSTFHVRSYRGIPAWIFNPLLIAADIFTFGSLILGIFFLQEIGGRELAPSGSSNLDGLRYRSGLWIVLIIAVILHLITPSQSLSPCILTAPPTWPARCTGWNLETWRFPCCAGRAPRFCSHPSCICLDAIRGDRKSVV